MQPSLFDAPDPNVPADQAARDFAVDPLNDVVLEASAGTGKTRVLVTRYVRLIEQGVDPSNILAMTFTRKAAAEMRDRVVAELRARAVADVRMAERWRTLRERIADIEISTIDAFCFSLLREFPLEANVDPGFDIADETEVGRFLNEALDVTMQTARALVVSDENVRLLLARVRGPALREALGVFVDRRHIALPAVRTFVRTKVRVADSEEAARTFMTRIRRLFEDTPDAQAILDDGPASPEFEWLRRDLAALTEFPESDARRVQQLQRRLERHFLTKDGAPRQKIPRSFTTAQFSSPAARKRHEAAVKALAPDIHAALEGLTTEVNGLLARGLLRVLTIAIDRYEALLGDHAVLDFPGMLEKAVELLERQEDFARSRLKLQSRYHHVLVDEFQDTSRPQWRLVNLLVDAWGEGEGAGDAPTSIFIVGDRKQSIYRFRHAEVTLLDEAARRISALRGGRNPRRAITHSFRAVPELLAFVNAFSAELQSGSMADERFTYTESDRFPVPDVAPGALRDGEPVLGIIAEPSMELCAAAVAQEVQRLLQTATVRDRAGMRDAQPGDIAVLFRARAGHQYYERALEAAGVRTYVYKGLGFFDAPEVQDLQALLRFLAMPDSELRAAEFLRSRIVRISDAGLAALAPSFSRALCDSSWDVDAALKLDEIDRTVLARARSCVARWLAAADRIPPSELVDLVLRESAYAFELGGRRFAQARENVKKVRALVRRVENRGYATLARIADYFETLRTGDESNATIEAAGCVNLMTIHAAKGLEFPIVFVVNVHAPGRGRSQAVSVIERGPDDTPDVTFGSSDATRAEDDKEDEELRRLLYVALTRARDRLYLAGETDPSGRLKRGARSLGGLLPAGVRDLFAVAAASTAPAVQWTSPAGTFAFRVCKGGRVSEETTPGVGSSSASAEPTPGIVSSLARPRPPVGVSAFLREGERDALRPRPEDASQQAGADQRLVGTLVHRMFHRRTPATLTVDETAARARELLRPDERGDAPGVETAVQAAAVLFVRLRNHPDVAALFASGECQFEVPFSVRVPESPDRILRGSIDCVVTSPDGTVTLLEFKTGRPRPEHGPQLEIYRRALEAALPGREIVSKIVYP